MQGILYNKHMKKIYLIILIIIIIILAIVIYNRQFNEKPTQSPSDIEAGPPQSESFGGELPMERARERVNKKPFGIKISPNNSPVSPERFSGYHTGVDYEIFEGEENIDVEIFAICSGKLLKKETAAGYGGLLVQSCELDNQPVTVIYGHIRLSSVQQNVGDHISKQDVLGVLGAGFSQETDGERKHLHLGIHKGTDINIRGYVQILSELNDWIDFEQYFPLLPS